MARRIGVGVIGVGANWRRRYRPALEALSQFRVHAVFDPAYDRAARVAHSLGFGVADHLTALIEATGVEAVILAGAGWYGLWPLELAIRHGKPALCAASRILADPRLADGLEPGSVVLAALPGLLDPAAERLEELVRTRLGSVRTAVVECARVAGPGGLDPAELGLAALCLRLFGAPPNSARSLPGGEAGAAVRALDWEDGRRALFVRWRAAEVPNPHDDRLLHLRLRLECDRGRAILAPPGRLSWSAGPARAGHTTERFGGDRTALALGRFAQTVRGERAAEGVLPLLAAAARWLTTPAGAV